jgi:hypothetical protein
MTEQVKETAIKKFEYLTLVKINPGESTLPIDTVAEWSKAFGLVNYVIYLLGKSIYIEEYRDELGVMRELPKIHPQLLSFMQERRKLQDQMWKISGGEARNEGKKEFFRKQADFIFQMSQDNDFKEKHKESMKKILEAEIYEET